MKVKLVCSENNKEIITEFLLANNFEISDSSKIVIAEEGINCPKIYDAKIIYNPDRMNEFSDFLASIKPKGKIENIIIGMDNGTYKPLMIEDICYFNGQNNDTFAHLSNGKKYLVRSKLYQLEEELYDKHFFRINKSELVNMKKITLITPMFKGKLLINLEGYKEPFDISRSFTKSFKERLGF